MSTQIVQVEVPFAVIHGSAPRFVPPAASPSPRVSIVSSMYRSRTFLDAFLRECVEAAAEMGCGDSFEIVLVNDGSPDDSLQYALSRRADLAQLVVVDLSRNFGHHCALLAGLEVARGEYVCTIDCDLEVRPRTLVEFYRVIAGSDIDMVYGFQEARKGGLIERAAGGLFYKGFNLLSDIPIPESVLTERIMTRRLLDALFRMGDRNLFLAGMMSWTGFRQVGVPVPKRQREGASTYTLARRAGLMVNAVSSFSSKPLVWLFNAGLSITAISIAYLLYLVVRKVLFDDSLVGFTSLMGMLVLSLGILTTAIGIVGIYLGKVFNQVLARPAYVIRSVHRQ